MIILGIALAVVALVVFAFVAVGGGGEAVTISAFGVDLTTTALVLFVTGAATLLVLLAGLWMIRWGLARASRTRAEIQRLRRIEAEVEARQVAELSEPAGAPRDAARTSPQGRDVPPPPPPVAPGDRGGESGGHDMADDAVARRADSAAQGDETRVLRPFERDRESAGSSPASPAGEASGDDRRR